MSESGMILNRLSFAQGHCKCKRAIFQTFWKPDCCPDFLFLELETSNFGYLLIFLFSLTLQGFSEIGQH